MGGSLLEHHHHALDTLVSTMDAATIDVDELNGWLGAVEVLRLLLGTQLDVSEDFAGVDRRRPPGGPVHRVPVPEHAPERDRRHARRRAAPGRDRDVSPRLLTIMGSGETAPTMVKVHRGVVEQLGPGAGPGLLLDTPFGFQTNAAEIASRAVTYFRDSVGATLEVAGLRARRGPRGSRRRRHRRQAGRRAVGLRRARQPHLRPAAVGGDARARRAGREARPRRGAHLRLGRRAHPGAGRPCRCTRSTRWARTPAGCPGSTCWPPSASPWRSSPTTTTPRAAPTTPGSATWARSAWPRSSTSCPRATFVLGVDEHTALCIDLDAEQAAVAGHGGVTVRVRGRSRPPRGGRGVRPGPHRGAGRRAGRGPASGRRRGGLGTRHDGESAARWREPPARGADRTPAAALGGAGGGPPLLGAVRRPRGGVPRRPGCGATRRPWWRPCWPSTTSCGRGAPTRCSPTPSTAGAPACGPWWPSWASWPRSARATPPTWWGRSSSSPWRLRDGARPGARFADADAVRDRLVALGVEVNDTPEGSAWRLATAQTAEPALSAPDGPSRPPSGGPC